MWGPPVLASLGHHGPHLQKQARRSCNGVRHGECSCARGRFYISTSYLNGAVKYLKVWPPIPVDLTSAWVVNILSLGEIRPQEPDLTNANLQQRVKQRGGWHVNLMNECDVRVR